MLHRYSEAFHGKRNSLVLVMHPSGAGEVAPVLNEVTITPHRENVVQKHELEFDQQKKLNTLKMKMPETNSGIFLNMLFASSASTG